MSDLAKKLMGSAKFQSKGKPKLDQKGQRSDLPEEKGLAKDEGNALKKIRSEAAAAGSELASGGKGGMPPSTILGVFRKFKFRCAECGELGDLDKNGGLSAHHKFQHMTNPAIRAKGIAAIKAGKRNEKSQMEAICVKCHDELHQEDRKEYGGKDADEVVEGK